MSDNFIGEIRLFAFNYAPDGWHFCDGTPLVINQYQALYSLIGIQFGGNTTNFNLPDLRGRTPVHAYPAATDASRIKTGAQGSTGGTDSITLTATQVPDHTHPMYASSATGTELRAATSKSSNIPATPVPYGGNPSALKIYAPPATTGLQALSANAVAPLGVAVAHENRQPYIATNYCIAMTGYYPTRP